LFCFLFLFLFVFLADRLRRRRRQRCYHYDDARHDDKDVGRTAPLHRNNKRQKNVRRRRKRSEKRLRLPLHTVDLSHWYACRIPNSGIQGMYAASYSTHTVFRFPTSQVARIWKKPKGTEDSLSRRELTRGLCYIQRNVCQRATSECRGWLFSRQLNSEAPLLSLSLPVSPQYGDVIDSTAATRVKKSVVWRSNPPGFSLSHTHTHGHRHTTTKTPQRRRKVTHSLKKRRL